MGQLTKIEWCDATLETRFWSKVDKRSDEECWNWTAAKTKGGYGVITANGKHTTAHRVSFYLAFGVMSQTLVVDHKCRNRSCVNPAHLQMITRGQNVRIGLKGMLKTHCDNGHEFTEESTGKTKQGRRFCLICRRERESRRGRDAAYYRAYRAARKEKQNG